MRSLALGILLWSPLGFAGFNEEVGAVLQQHINAKACSELLLKIKDPGKSHDDFELLISREGKLQKITFHSKTAGMESYFDCLKAEMKDVQFPIPPNKKDYIHRTAIDWSFHGEGTPGAVPGDMTVQSNEGLIQRQNEVRDYVFKSKEVLWACYRDYKGRLKKEAKSGTITLSWTVYGTGLTSKVVVDHDDFEDTKLATCVSGAISRMKFPAPPQSAVVEMIKFPISFTKKK